MQLDPQKKQEMINQRLEQYKTQMFEMEMNAAACRAIGDEEGANQYDKRRENILKAYVAIEGMK